MFNRRSITARRLTIRRDALLNSLNEEYILKEDKSRMDYYKYLVKFNTIMSIYDLFIKETLSLKLVFGQFLLFAVMTTPIIYSYSLPSVFHISPLAMIIVIASVIFLADYKVDKTPFIASIVLYMLVLEVKFVAWGISSLDAFLVICSGFFLIDLGVIQAVRLISSLFMYINKKIGGVGCRLTTKKTSK